MAKPKNGAPSVTKSKSRAEKFSEFLKDPRYPSSFSLIATFLFSLNFFTFNFGPVYSALAAILAFFSPGHVLLDAFLPKDALDGFVERLMMSITLSICFTVLYVSIVNLGLSAPINRTVLGYLLISLNVGISGARLAYLRFRK